MVLNTYHKASQSYKKLRARNINKLPITINWGNTRQQTGLNNDVSGATNKLLMLKTLDENEVPTLEWTTDKETAKENTPIYCRTITSGSKGRGIIIAHKPEEVVNAPLYTKALEDYDEYRIHVMKDKVFYTQRKIPREGEANTKIKTLNNYYFSKRDTTRLHPKLLSIAKDTIEALELDFGAVDLIKKGNDIKVLEVNTAPGLDNSTANAYARAFKDLYYENY